MDKPLQAQIDDLTALLARQHAAHANAANLLHDKVNFLLARTDLMDEVLQVLLANAPEHVRTIAIAAAQVKGERLQEQGSPEIARYYAQKLRGIEPTHPTGG